MESEEIRKSIQDVKEAIEGALLYGAAMGSVADADTTDLRQTFIITVKNGCVMTVELKIKVEVSAPF